MIKGLLFDFDGTMIDTREGIENSWKVMYKKVKNQEIPADVLRNSFGEPLKTSLAKIFPELDMETAIKIYREYGDVNPDKMLKPFPGIVEMIKKLAVAGYDLAVVTSRMEPSTMEGLENAGMKQCFKSVQTATNCKNHKPHPEPILKALEELGLEKEQVLMVGDTLFDLQAAKAAGVKSVLVGWTLDVTEEEKVGKFAPDYILETPMDIFKLIKEEENA